MNYVKLSSIAEVSSGQGAPQGDNSYGMNGIPFIKAGNLEDLLTTKDEYKSCGLVSSSVAQEYRLKEYPVDTIVFAKSGMSAMKGRVYCLNNTSYVVNHLATIIPIKEKVKPQYLKYFFQKFQPSNLIKDRAYPSIRLEDIGNTQVLLPSIEIQQIIIDSLNEADSLRQKRKQAIDLLDEYLKSVFLEMFGDPLDNPKKFEVLRLSQVYVNEKDGTKCGPFGSALKKEEYVSSGIPVWTMDNIQGIDFIPERYLFITNDKYQDLAKYQVLNDDIIISRAGTVGKMAVVYGQLGPSIISTNLIRLRLNKDKLLPTYFVRLMTYCKGRVGRLRTGKDGTFTHMNTGILDNLTFPLPPIYLQQKYAQIVQEIENLKQKMHEQSDELDNQFNALMQKHFNSN